MYSIWSYSFISDQLKAPVTCVEKWPRSLVYKNDHTTIKWKKTIIIRSQTPLEPAAQAWGCEDNTILHESDNRYKYDQYSVCSVRTKDMYFVNCLNTQVSHVPTLTNPVSSKQRRKQTNMASCPVRVLVLGCQNYRSIAKTCELH